MTTVRDMMLESRMKILRSRLHDSPIDKPANDYAHLLASTHYRYRYLLPLYEAILKAHSLKML